jgi:LPXTG-site transpeptidase (sortase) family protein
VVLLALTGCAAGASQPAAPSLEAVPTSAPSSAAPSPSRSPRPVKTVPITNTQPSAVGSDRASRPGRFVLGSIDLPVVPVGVADDGGMKLPSTAYAIGWYSFGARPADRSGTTVLAGHVDTRKEGLGPLAALRAVDRGAKITLTAADGTARRYRVDEVRAIRKARVPLESIFSREGEERLVVITCGGPYDRSTGYRDNVIVTARPM